MNSVQALDDMMHDRRGPENPVESILHEICSRIMSIGDDYSQSIALKLFKETIRYLVAVGEVEKRRKSLENGYDAYLQYRTLEGGFW